MVSEFPDSPASSHVTAGFAQGSALLQRCREQTWRCGAGTETSATDPRAPGGLCPHRGSRGSAPSDSCPSLCTTPLPVLPVGNGGGKSRREQQCLFFSRIAVQTRQQASFWVQHLAVSCRTLVEVFISFYFILSRLQIKSNSIFTSGEFYLPPQAGHCVCFSSIKIC